LNQTEYETSLKKELLDVCRRVSVVRRGEITLASGRTTDVYLDMRKAILDGAGCGLIAELFRLKVGQHYPELQAIGGMGYGAAPLVGSFLFNCPMTTGFLVRKGQKEYGTQKMVEGDISPGTRCGLLEDVTTTGGSVLSAAIKTAEVTGERPKFAFTVVDRGEGAVEMLASQGITLIPLLTMGELLETDFTPEPRGV
jgi:orotate phosphoribosyltransferase